MAQKRTKEGGTHDEEINMEEGRRGKKKNQFQYQNTGSNLAALFIQTVLESNYPMQAPKQGFAVAG